MQPKSHLIRCSCCCCPEIEITDPNAQPTTDASIDNKSNSKSKERKVSEVMRALRKIDKAIDPNAEAELLGIPIKTVNHYKLYTTKARRLGMSIKEYEKISAGFGMFVQDVERNEELVIKQIYKYNKERIAECLSFQRFKMTKKRSVTRSSKYITIHIRVYPKEEKNCLRSVMLKYDAKQTCILKEVLRGNSKNVQKCSIIVK